MTEVKTSANRSWRLHPGVRPAALIIMMLSAGSAAHAQTTLLEVGNFVSDDMPCEHAAAADILVSNGHAVSPPGQACRVTSRISTGAYYPLFNEVCDGGQGITAILSIKNRHSIWFQFSGQASRSYRFCPAKVLRTES